MPGPASDFADLPTEFLIELGSAPTPFVRRLPEQNQPGVMPLGARPRLRAAAPAGTTLRYSQRGWIGEPGDASMPNVAYPRRLVEPPVLTRSIRVLPEESARRTFQAGEVRLDNEDGLLDQVTGDWSMAGRPAILLRGPHRQPLRAAYGEFERMAELRITGAAISAAGRVTIGLREAARDLAVPLTTAYAGTGLLEGDAVLKGRMRPVLLGAVVNVPVVALLAQRLVYQVSALALASISSVRDGGAQIGATADYPTLAALLAASIPTSRFATCLALGLIRLGSPPQRQVTVDAQAAGPTTHAGIMLALLAGPGGLSSDRIDAPLITGTLPGGLAGFLFTGGGTVEEALNTVAGSCAAWWGSDRLGRITAGRLFRPEASPPDHAVARWMLKEEPAEIEGTPPRWRQRVAYRLLGLVQSASDLTGIAQADQAAVAAFGTAQQLETAFDAAVLAAFPSATDPEPLKTGWQLAVDAQAQAVYLLGLHGARRRRWRVPLGKWGSSIDVGQSVSVDHPRLGGRNWLVTGMDDAGDSKTLTLWG